jgi:hypothetical protein
MEVIQNGLVSVSRWTGLSSIISVYYGELCRAYMLVCIYYMVWAVMHGCKLLILGCISCGTANAVKVGMKNMSNRQKAAILDAKYACLSRLSRRRSVGRALLYDAVASLFEEVMLAPPSGFTPHLCGLSGIGFNCPACEALIKRS